jgi:hypothetical protein
MARVKKPKLAATAKALDQLVSQFAQPLAFLRELVQNSLDASTELIEVDVGYDDEAECCFVRVRDTGVGMDRNIIDSKLTRLFSSSKENDLTKIGKFGIGFVSIFAIKPKLVVLETGRDGESWRLLFKPDRSFERRELKTPVEGTSVTVFTPKKRSELAQLQADCKETVAFWCRHSEVEIQFNGQPINQPFDLPGHGFSYRHKIEGTEVVVAPSVKSLGFHGYYNRGLTLLEGEGSPLPHVSFKLRSRYLEHTLSRDNIIFDEHYEKAMAEVKLAAYSDMPAALLQALTHQDDPRMWALARIVAKYPEPARQALAKAAIFPSNGRRLRLGQLGQDVFIHPQVDDFWRAVEATGVTIVQAEEGDDKVTLLGELGCKTSALRLAFSHFAIRADLPEPEAALLEALKSADRSLQRLVLVQGLQISPAWRSRFCGYLQPETGVATVPCPAEVGSGYSIGVFGDHPFWQRLLSLHGALPELALSLGMRKISLDLNLGSKGEAKLVGRLMKSLRDKASLR